MNTSSKNNPFPLPTVFKWLKFSLPSLPHSIFIFHFSGTFFSRKHTYKIFAVALVQHRYLSANYLWLLKEPVRNQYTQPRGKSLSFFSFVCFYGHPFTLLFLMYISIGHKQDQMNSADSFHILNIGCGKKWVIFCKIILTLWDLRVFLQ